jgi:DNA-nicking Smr family endonuclease
MGGKIPDDDAFRDAMSDVAPLAGKQQRVLRDPTVVEATPAQLERREAALGLRSNKIQEDPNYLTLGEVPQLNPREILEWKKDGVQHGVFSRLKAGKYPIEGWLDLHRHTVKESRAELFKFLNLAFEKRWRTVSISHGRGEKSATPARIKSYVAAWLTRIPEVIAFHSAQNNQGGTGAVYVLLKKVPAAKDENRERFGGRAESDDS